MNDIFEEIVGYEEIKRELCITLDMMKNYEIYSQMGAEKINGILLHGNPGTGKTTMAECFIKGADINSFTLRKKKSDGSFVDEIVNVLAQSIILCDG